MRRAMKSFSGGVAALALALTGGVMVAGSAQAAVGTTPRVLINEVYGGGGNSGATLTNDFIELVNASTAPVDVSGWSVQYASATGSSWATTPLTGVIQPGAAYVVVEAAGAGGTTPVTGAVTGSLALSGTAGQGRARQLLHGAVLHRVGLPRPRPGGRLRRVRLDRDRVRGQRTGSRRLEHPGRDAQRDVGQHGGQRGGLRRGQPDAGRRGRHRTGDPDGRDDRADPGHRRDLAARGRDRHHGRRRHGGLPHGRPERLRHPDPGHPTRRRVRRMRSSSSRPRPPRAVAIGDHVQVTGVVSEFNGLTELTVAAAADLVKLPAAAAVTPVSAAWPTTDAAREALESMLFQPTGDLTISNTYSHEPVRRGRPRGRHAPAAPAHRGGPSRVRRGAGRGRRQRRPRCRARRRLVDQLPVGGELGPDPAVREPDQPGPRRRVRDHHGAGDRRLPQQRLEAQPDAARSRRRHVRERPDDGPGRGRWRPEDRVVQRAELLHDARCADRGLHVLQRPHR